MKLEISERERERSTMGQWLNWLPRINSSGGRANSFFFFFFFFDTRAKILGEEGEDDLISTWTARDTDGYTERNEGTVCIRSRIREANLSWPLLDSLILELVLRARRILAFEMDGYIRCGGSGDARWWGTCSTIVSTCLKFFFFF